jgi:two-component system, cell cycle response regulator DivK
MSHSILVIDDNELNLKLAEKILTLSGYNVLVAISGEQGVDVARAHRPDLILLDIRLPDIDGLEVLRRLRSLPETRGIPVVAMTAQAMPAEVDRFAAAGFDGYVQKPISIASFRAEVQRHLSAATLDRSSHN